MSLWLASYVALWLVVLLIVFSVLVLFRQLGVLHLRFGPRGALATDEGPELNTLAPMVESVDMTGRQLRIGGVGSPTTVVFVSPKCSVCEDLLPAIRALHRAISRDVQVVVAVDGNGDLAASWARRLGAVPVLADLTVSELYGVAGTPYAVHIDGSGVVRRKGVVNTLEQLESVAEDPNSELAESESESREREEPEEVYSHDHA